MIENKLRCLLVEPYRLPEVIEINNTLEDKQKIVVDILSVLICQMMKKL